MVSNYHRFHQTDLLNMPNSSIISSGENDEELQPAIQSIITQRASITVTKALHHVVPYEIQNKTRCSITL